MSITIKDSTPLMQNIQFGSDDVLVVDFWAEWCPPCKAMAPILDEIAAEMPNIKVVKINVDEETFLPEKYNVKSIPTFLIFKPKQLMQTDEPNKVLVGGMPKKKLIEAIKSVL